MALEGVDLGLPVDEVDIDEDRDSALEYGIRSVPTMILIRNDAEVKRMSGVKSVDEIRKWISD
jgi:thioredoxin 1